MHVYGERSLKLFLLNLRLSHGNEGKETDALAWGSAARPQSAAKKRIEEALGASLGSVCVLLSESWA